MTDLAWLYPDPFLVRGIVVLVVALRTERISLGASEMTSYGAGETSTWTGGKLLARFFHTLLAFYIRR
jgi:hypothetical protein